MKPDVYPFAQISVGWVEQSDTQQSLKAGFHFIQPSLRAKGLKFQAPRILFTIYKAMPMRRLNLYHKGGAALTDGTLPWSLAAHHSIRNSASVSAISTIELIDLSACSVDSIQLALEARRARVFGIPRTFGSPTSGNSLHPKVIGLCATWFRR